MEKSLSGSQCKDIPTVWPSFYTPRTQTYVSTKIYTQTFVAALFVTTPNWKPSWCPSTGDWIKKLWDLHKGEYHSTIKRNKWSIFTIAWMNLKVTILGEWSQTKKKLYICFCLYNILGNTNNLWQNKTYQWFPGEWDLGRGEARKKDYWGTWGIYLGDGNVHYLDYGDEHLYKSNLPNYTFYVLLIVCHILKKKRGLQLFQLLSFNPQNIKNFSGCVSLNAMQWYIPESIGG